MYIKKHSTDGEKTAPQTHAEYHRASTLPVKSYPCTVIRHPLVAVDLDDEKVEEILKNANKENDGNYDQPVLNTILALSRQMQEMKLAKPLKRIAHTDDLSPRTKAVVMPKISAKLNFPPDKIVFRDLIPINVNVNDSNLLPKKKLSLRKKYIKSKQRVPTPDLGDFLDPLPPMKHIISEPKIELIHGPDEIDVFGEFLEFYREVNPRWMRMECF